MIEQSTLYILGFVIIVVIGLQYVSFMVSRKYVKSEIGKVARAMLKNKSSTPINQQTNNMNDDDNKDNDNNDESVDVDTPTNIENEDIDSYVNPVPSVDKDD